jgi:flavin-dependent dehydrogenase
MKTDYDAIIIGAGPAGSTAAILLACAGWSVLVLEKQCFPRRKVCGECIAAPNLPLLEALGVGDRFEELAGPDLRKVALMCGKDTIVADLPPLMDSRYQWGRALGREYLDLVLLDRATQVGASVLQPWTARAVRERSGTFQCDAKAVNADQSMTLTASVLIAAHGSWELTPSDDAQRRLQRPSDLFAFKANFSHTDLAHELLPVLAFDGGYGGMVVGDHGITTLACCIRRDRLSACRKEMRALRAGEVVESYLKKNCAGVQHALAGAQRDGVWLGTGPIQPGIRMPCHRDGIFLIGNAAGEAHPIIGEGISMAMQSAWLLCGYLNAHRKSLVAGELQLHRQVHRDYADAWRRQFARRIHLAAAFAHLAMRPGLASGLLPLLRRRPDLLTRAARWSGKIKHAIDEPALHTATS